MQNGQSATEPHVAALAKVLAEYLQNDALPMGATHNSIGSRLHAWIQSIGERIGRKAHRIVIIVFAANLGARSNRDGVIATLFVAVGSASGTLFQRIITEAEAGQCSDASRCLHPFGLQTIVGLLYGASLILLRKREHAAINVALFASILSLTVVNLLTFYLDQFNALLSVAFTLVFFLLLVSYRAWYFADD